MQQHLASAAKGRVIALGDIHGCALALDAVLEAINPQADDLFISLGDFVDMGRETAEVIDRLLELSEQSQLVALCGNHEEMLLEALDSPRLKEQWLLLGGYQTLQSYRFGADIDVIPPDHLEFIRNCRSYYETDTHIFVHANYDPALPLSEQPDYVLRWALLEEPYPAPHISGKTVICGHTEQRRGEMLDLGHVKCIDTYCHGYGWLTALDVGSGQTWQASRWGALREGESVDALQRVKGVLRPQGRA